MAGKPRLLIAEDEPALAKVLKMRLEIEGFDVSTAGDGQEALDMIAADRPDLLICDLMMPVMDGFAVSRKIKSDPDLKSIPVLILSALKRGRETAELEKIGVDGFAAKPYDSKELTATIRRLLGG
ncbi:MAG TPA: response regulator [Candidatus Dormibacteraeota bacterium]|jgi:two-component system phosphate regulon response regulator PhoB|nr:response regulator [Candidatus Dormibacteraeota bacterium]